MCYQIAYGIDFKKIINKLKEGNLFKCQEKVIVKCLHNQIST